jgi:hypothetical protein
MLYFDHAAQITNIGRYIGYVLRPRLMAIVGDDQVLAWESSYLTFQQKPDAPPFQFGISTFVLFVGGPLSACIASLPTIDHLWHWLAWSVGLILELSPRTFGSCSFAEIIPPRYRQHYLTHR